MAYDEATAERVRKIFGKRRGVTEKKMMGGLSFMLNGAMCCSVSGRGGILIRVGAEGQERALSEPHVAPMSMGRRVMTGFVRVSPDGYRTDAALKDWIERGVAIATAVPKGGCPKEGCGEEKAARRAKAQPGEIAPRNATRPSPPALPRRESLRGGRG